MNGSLASFNMGNVKKTKISSYGLLLNSLFLVKGSISQLLIASLPYNSYMALASLIVFELVNLVVSIYCHFCLKLFSIWLIIIQKLCQSLGFISIITMMLVLKANEGQDNRSFERVIRGTIIGVVVMEYSFGVLVLVCSVLKDCKVRKNTKRQ